jgi:hypothetical protein
MTIALYYDRVAEVANWDLRAAYLLMRLGVPREIADIIV